MYTIVPTLTCDGQVSLFTVQGSIRFLLQIWHKAETNFTCHGERREEVKKGRKKKKGKQGVKKGEREGNLPKLVLTSHLAPPEALRHC